MAPSSHWPTLRVAPVALASLCLLAAPASGQTCSSNDAGSGLICPVTNLANGNPAVVGSLDWAIEQTNLGGLPDREHVIRFREALLELTIDLVTPLPAIALDPASRVELDGNEVGGFSVSHTPLDPMNPAPFTLLRVMSGQATIVELDISGGDFEIDAGARLGFRYAEEFEIEDDIVGAGVLFKEGAGRLLLKGNNGYVGGTEVIAGTLAGDTLALQGGFDVSDDARLELSIEALESESFAGTLTGLGGLLKSGTGVLTLTGNAGHLGGTEVAAGTLIATPANLSGDVQIGAGATLQLDQSALSAAYAGRLSGAGRLLKTGNGELELTGANSFGAGVTIAAGTLRGPAAAIPGDVLLETTPSLLIFDQPVAGTHVGNISGAGRLIKQGAGRLTLVGVSSHTGSTTVRAGSLAGDALSLQGTIVLEANPAEPTNLEFAQNTALAFNGTISGVGRVVKSGIGTLIFGTSQLHSGDTDVTGGLLRLDAPLPNSANLIVRSGAELRSDQNIGGNLDLFGALSIGAAGDSFDVGGSAQLRDGSQLVVSLTDLDQSSSKLVVSGNLDFAAGPLGSTVEVEAAPGIYTPQKTYTVVESTSGTLTGPGFSLTSPDYAFLDIGLPAAAGGSRYDITVVFNGNDVEQFAITPNQHSTARAMQELLDANTPDSLELERSFSVLTVAGVPPVLDQVGGETLGGFTTSRFAVAQQFQQAIARRFTASRFERRPEPKAEHRALIDVAAFEPERGQLGLGVWAEPFGSFGASDGGTNASDMSSRAYGVGFGVDYRFSVPGSQHLRAGLAGGYARHSLQAAGDRMDGSGDTFQLAGYGALQSELFHAGATLRYAHTSLESERSIFFGSIARRSEGSTSGGEVSASLETGLHLGDPARALFHPLAGLQYTHLDQNGYAEIGAGSLSLAVPRIEADSLLTTLGARVSRIFTLEGQYGIEPELRLGWAHEFGDLARPVTAAYYQVPGATPFVTLGASPDRDQLWVGGGYVMRIGDVPMLTTHYDAFIGKNYTRHVVSLGLYFRW